MPCPWGKMQIYRYPPPSLPTDRPIALSIGSFDGFHRGHQQLVSRLQLVASERGLASALFTYEEHPSRLLCPAVPTPQLCTFEQKVALLASTAVDYLFIARFDASFASQTAQQFLLQLREQLTLAHLQIGHDGRIGKGREGQRELLEPIASALGLSLDYCPPLLWKEQPISSTLLRQLIAQGHLSIAHELLGRPYSLYATRVPGAGIGLQLGYPTANLVVDGLIVPPAGVWSVWARLEGKKSLWPAVANLGRAPTLQPSRPLRLEVHLLDWHGPLQSPSLEIFFHRKLRDESRFSSKEALCSQIQSDVALARQQLCEPPSIE